MATVAATAKIVEPIQPIDRGDRYEDPLNDALQEKGWGSLTGGGTMMTEVGEIDYVDVEFDLEDRPEVFAFVREKLTEFGAPKGSELLVEDRDPLAFGASESVAIYLDGVNLPDEIYQESDPNVLIENLNEALGDAGEFRHAWDGPTETALYLFGADAEAMWKRAEPACRAYPLCRNSRIVLRRGPADSERREFRLPME